MRKLQKELEDAVDRAEAAEMALNKARSRARASGGGGAVGRQTSREVSRLLSPSYNEYSSYPEGLDSILSRSDSSFH